MNKIVKSIIALFAVIFIQIVIALLLFRPYIIEWGATKSEVQASLPGDEYTETILSTRAININKPQNEIWEYLVELGADRKGFYSYVFLEYLFGCKLEEQTNIKKNELKLGRLIPIKSSNSSDSHTIGFTVISIDQGQSFVLKDWGSFLIRKTDNNTSRLIIRTHGKTPNNLIEKLEYLFFDVLHYIMEKRMMLGIKDLAETNGKNYNYTTDWMWFIFVILTIMIGLSMVFIVKKKVIVPTIILSISQYFVLVLNPKPYFGITLLSITLLLAFLVYRRMNT